MDDDLPIITESEYNSISGLGSTYDNLPTMTESEYNSQFSKPSGGLWQTLAGVDTVAPSSLGEAFSNLGSNLTSSDWWLGRPSGEVISPKQAIAGPIAGINNAINPLGDETVAGANSIIDFLTGNPATYEQRLSEVRGVEKDFDKASPVWSTALDIAGAFKLPTKFGTASEPATALGRIGQALKEGSGWGAAFGFGNGEGTSERIQGGILGGGIGGLLAGTVSTGVEGLKKVLNVGELVPGLSKLLTSTPEQDAGQILKKAAGSDIEALVNDPNNPLFKYRTLAEHLQSPELAQIEQSLGKGETEANKILNANLNARQQAQKEVLQSLSPEVPLSAEAGGEKLRELIEPRAAAAKEVVKNLFDSIDPNGQVPMVELRSSFTKLAKDSYKAGGMPGDIAGLVEEVNKKVQFGDVLGKPKLQNYDYIKALRERAQDAWATLKNFQDTKGAGVANQLVRQIDASIDKAGNMGLMKKADIVKFKTAKKAGEEYFDIFGAKGAGNIIAKMKEGQYLSKASNVVQNTFDGSAEGTRKILRAVGDSPEEMNKARGIVRDFLMRAGEDNDGNISAGKFRTLLRKYKEGINASIPGGKKLFEDNHLKALDDLAQDLAFVDTQSNKSVKQLAYTASRGQPTTAQALMSKNIASRFLGATVSKFDDWFTASRNEQVNAILTTAITNPHNAKLLLNHAQSSGGKEGLYKLLTSLALPIKALPSASPVFGRGSGSLASTLTARSKPKKEDKSSFNSTLDKALTQAEKQIAMDKPKPVEIIEAKRTSSKVPSDSFIEKEEGGQQLKAYPPPAKGSGITVGTGVDLGQHSEKDLEEMGVSDKTIYKVRKYLGKKDAIARAALKEKPLELTKEEADELDAAVHGDIYGTIEDKLKAKGVTLAKLPEEAQTVIKSIAINFGKNFDEKIPSIWKAITEKDWSKVQDLLVNTKWKQPELVARRKREADLLSRIV